MTQIFLKEKPSDDRPYERCLRLGPGVLSNAELLAVILRTGRQGADAIAVAKEILQLGNKDEGLLRLCHLSVPELMTVNGIGEVKAIQLQCLGELSKRMASEKAVKKISFNSPETIADYYMESLRHREQECLISLMMDTRNRFLADRIMTIGTVNASLVSPREIFMEALRQHAVNIILIHNHPSGDPSPSREDKEMTLRIQKAGKMLEIQLMDHIIIGDHDYFSFCEKGLL